jgi:3-oxoacyl-[acyl-carrier protein] reductase
MSSPTSPLDPSQRPLVALVTGASRGIGRAICLALARRGVNVAIHYGSDAEKAQETKEQCEAAALASRYTGRRFLPIQASIEDPAQCQALLTKVLREFDGHCDVLVNNAGVSVDQDIRTMNYAEWQRIWDRTLNINYLGAANLMFLFCKHSHEKARSLPSTPTPQGSQSPNSNGSDFGSPTQLRPQCVGRVVNVSSRAAYAGDVTAPAYAVSKKCLNTLSQAFAKEYAAEGIFVYTVAPGATDTEMWGLILSPTERAAMDASHPLKRIGAPEEVASAVVYCALDAPGLLTGAIIDANGAMYTH